MPNRVTPPNPSPAPNRRARRARRLVATGVAASLTTATLAASTAPVAAGTGPAAPAATVPAVALAAALDPGALVEAAYPALLGRPVDPAGRAYWGAVAAADPRAVLAGLAGSAEHRRWTVTQAYRAVLGRDPDAAGLDWLVGWMERGATGTVVTAVLYGSPEFLARAGGTPDGFVRALYTAILGRPADATGLAHFAALVAAGVPRSYVAYEFLVAPEAATRPGLSVLRSSPAAGEVTRSLAEITLTLDRAVVPEASTVLLTVDGRPLPATVAAGDFADTLVVVPTAAPDAVPQGQTAGVEVTVVAYDGAVVERADVRLVYERPVESLRSGD